MPEWPRKVYYPRPGKEPKVINARNELELSGLLRIGWKLEPPK